MIYEQKIVCLRRIRQKHAHTLTTDKMRKVQKYQNRLVFDSRVFLTFFHTFQMIKRKNTIHNHHKTR